MERNRPLTCQEISLDEKECIFDDNDNVAIFDDDQAHDESNENERQLFKEIENEKADKKMIEKIEQEIKSSKENFFKVKIVKDSDKPKKMLKSENLKHATKNKNHAHLVIKEGYLEKKYDSNIFFKWTRRFFALNSDKLYCFADRSKEKLVGCINFKRLPAQLNNLEGLEIEIDFYKQCQNLRLKAESTRQKKQWIECLSSVIDIHCLEGKMLFKTISKPLYEERDSLTEREFLEQCETGDVLLFFTNHTGGKIQRFLTASDYDHVGMIVKFQKNQAMVFEANQISGVALYDWKYYIHYFDLYQKVALRKLKYIRKQQAHAKLLNFVKKSLGKKYDLNAFKFFKQQSNFQWTKEDQQRGFFCSELIAKAYKTVGLLEPKKASSKYWPVDFSQKAGIELKLGASLDREQIIVLNKHLKKRL